MCRGIKYFQGLKLGSEKCNSSHEIYIFVMNLSFIVTGADKWRYIFLLFSTTSQSVCAKKANSSCKVWPVMAFLFNFFPNLFHIFTFEAVVTSTAA